MQAKIALITGATNGVGKAMVHWLAARGAELIVTGRNQEKLTALLEELNEQYPDTAVHSMQADQLQLSQVARMADDLGHLPRLDILVNNAALCPKERQTSPEGYEAAFTINYLSHKLLTLKLLDKLKQANGYIMHVSSSAMGGGVIDFDNLHLEQHFNGWQAYANSKLANTLFSNLLAEKLQGASVRSNAVCPGMVRSGLMTGHPMFAGREAALYEASKPPEEAADYLGWMLEDPEVSALSGYFFSKGFHGRQPVLIQWDKSLAEKTVELLGRFTQALPENSNIVHTIRTRETGTFKIANFTD